MLSIWISLRFVVWERVKGINIINIVYLTSQLGNDIFFPHKMKVSVL